MSLYSSTVEAFTCCFIDYQKTFGGTCDPGHTYAGCSVSKIGGGGTCQLIAGGSGADCSCRVRFHNNGTDGATCEVAIHQRRICD